jgi:hypothetical protein
MLTVGSLLSDCGLELAAGAARAESPVRWVHISEHEDPTPWLSGGELLLTTGINLGTAAKQRRFVELLAAKGLAGLGFGVGFDHKRIPKAIVDAADTSGLPLFEVPYEMPFIAITERAASRLVNEQFGVLERGAHVHERLERLVIEGQGLDQILASTGAAIGGTALVLDPMGRELPAARATTGWRAPRPRRCRARCSTGGRRNPRRRRSRRLTGSSRDGPWRFRSPAAVAAHRSPGSRSSPPAIRSATSSGSAPARQRSWSASS